MKWMNGCFTILRARGCSERGRAGWTWTSEKSALSDSDLNSPSPLECNSQQIRQQSVEPAITIYHKKACVLLEYGKLNLFQFLTKA